MALVIAFGALPTLAPAAGHDRTAPVGPANYLQGEYNVTFNSTTIGELVLRNVIVENVQVGEVVVDEMTVGNETSEDVQLENVSLSRLEIERAVVRNVSTGELSIRNKSILDVPGGELIGNAGDRSLKRHVVANLTVTGVEIERLHLANLTIETELTEIEGDVEDGAGGQLPEKPDVSIGEADAETAVVTNASFRSGSVENASVEGETVTPETEEDDSDGTGDGTEEGSLLSARIGR